MRSIPLPALIVLLLITTLATAQDDIAGLWSYESFEQPNRDVTPLVGLFLFHEGRFVHQAMHGGEPLEQQLTDAHFGNYRILSPGVVELKVEIGIVVEPEGDSLLSARSNSRHEMGYERSGGNLFVRYANGTTEKLVRVPTERVQIVTLDQGALALSDKHFVFVAKPAGGWVAGSGRYRRIRDDLFLDVWRGFRVDGDQARYTSGETIAAKYDGTVLQISDVADFRVVRE